MGSVIPGVGALRAVRGRTWLIACVVTLSVLVSGVTWLAVSRSEDRQERFAANQRQLARACAGLLPDELGDFVPDDEPGVLDEFGTMLRPRHESRALLDCTLSWGGGDDAWEPDARARVRAEAVLTRTSPPPLDGSFGLPLPDSALGAVSVDDKQLDGSTVTASLLADCPKGLSGRVRPSRDLLVTVDLPSAADEYDVPKAERLLASRTAVRVADWVSRRQGCGGEPLASASGTTPDKAPKLCDWLSPAALRFAPGDWTFDRNASAYSRRSGACGGRLDDSAEPADRLAIRAAGAESWSGVLAGGAYDSHRGNNHAPDPEARTGAGKPVTIARSGDDPLLALWARSECDAGATYHRVTVTPELEFGQGTPKDSVVLEPKERRRLSERARALLDRYLAAPDGWPKRAHCRDTKIMGEVPEWRG
ncbi:hypothetical protein [Streptomyces alboniger]|uniref:hypothetical protein n=1 Tax=Streptomyces alboniger TaxID=132473 RepID=UPI0006E31981|nr:hypothetical protein [Streptomyces alboniger]